METELLVTIVTTIFSVIFGGIVTRRVAKSYYEKAAKDLEKTATDLYAESREIVRLSTITLRTLEENGMVELNRDEKGNIRGMVINASGTASGRTILTGSLTVKKLEDKDTQ